jgi:cytochrome c oxidase subunit I+III
MRWRAALVTSFTYARPQEIFRVAGPSIWPFVSAVGLITIFAAEVFSERWLVLLGALTLLVGVIAWNWPEKTPITEDEELAFEREYDVPVSTKGSAAISRGAMALLLLVLGIALGSLLLAYFYLRLDNPVWPPSGIALPQPLLAGLATLLLAVAAICLGWAVRQIERGQPDRLRLGLGLGFLLGAAALALVLYEFGQFEFDWSVNAYASIFYTLGGFLITQLAAGLVMAILVQYWAWRGEYSARHCVAVGNLAWYWYALLAGWIIGFATLYFGPLLARGPA